MAKDRRKLQHIHSSIADRQPTPATLEVGEIAVNNYKDKEFLSIKNTENGVVRFSSDAQAIEWMERKEVMPYVGYVRGDGGPQSTSGDSPIADAMGSYGISNDDLLNNTSEIIIKLNQVAASNTTKHDKVNGKKDKYNKDVNPTDDYGVNDGAGFFIDMSRYAMRGGNPSFSSITVTDKTDLYGNTTIADGQNSHGTDTGHTLTITTTDVIFDNTNWSETIVNKNSTIGTLNEDITERNSEIGTEYLHVSGTTTEIKDGDVEETNKSNKVVNTSGTTTYNNIGTTTTNESGDTIFNTVGDTVITSTGSTTIQSLADNSSVNIYAGTDGEVNVTGKTLTLSGNTDATLKAPTVTVSGDTINIFGSDDVNVTGDTVIISASTTLFEEAPTIEISGETISMTGKTNISGDTTLENNLYVSGNSVIEGDVLINGKLDVPNYDVVMDKTLYLINTNDAELSRVTPPALVIGLSGDTHLEVDTDEIMAKSSESTSSTLYLNREGGVVSINELDGNCGIGTSNPGSYKLYVNGNEYVNGTITANGAIYSSDRELKENIKFIERDEINKVKDVFAKSFNFKGETNKMYGVIAQEVQDAGLNELVYTKDDGHLAVDYTSFLILKMAYLEDFCAMLNGRIVDLEKELNDLKNKK